MTGPAQKLQSRFFLINNKADSYYDTVTHNTLTKSSIWGVAMTLMNNDYSEAKRLVNTMHFHTILSTPTYRPNKQKIFEHEGLYFRNAWIEPKHEPFPAKDAKPFISHLEKALGSTQKAGYLLDVMAHRLQHPDDSKPHIAFYFYHSEGGMGKSLFIDTLKNALGANSVKTINTTKGLESGSAVEAWNTSWLVVEEAGVTKGSKVYDTIKSYTGADSVDSDAKHKGFNTYETPAMLMLMSNRPPTFIEPYDRRFFVSEWHIEGGRKERQEYFNDYIEWLKSGGYKAIHNLLMKREVTVDIRVVPDTQEKLLAMNVAENPIVRDIKDFLEDNQEYWFFDGNEFKDIFGEHRVSSGRGGHLLAEAELTLTDTRHLVKGKQRRLYCIKGAFIDNERGKGLLGKYQGTSKRLDEVTLTRGY